MLPGGPVTAWPDADPARVYLGWQHAPVRPDPGPPPPRPACGPSLRLDPGWVAAQRLIEGRLARPARLGFAACIAMAGLLAVAWLAGQITAALAGAGVLAALAGALPCARSLTRGRRRLAALITAERDRIAAANAAGQRLLATAQAEHASAYLAWRDNQAGFERQPVWFAVGPDTGIDRVDLVGGTLGGWSALLTTIAVPRLSAGGQVTVLDLTEGAVASDLVNLAHRSGLRPLVWTLPRDLSRLDLGTGLGSAALADVLALAVSASPQAGQTTDTSADCALLERVLGVLGPDPAMAQVSAALRVLADIGDPRADLRSGLLTAEQLERIGMLFGRGAAERVVIERAWALESRLRWLDSLGSDPVSLPPSRLRVASLDRRNGVIGNRMLGTYLTAALTHMLRQAGPGSPWEHVLCLLGADRLRGEVIDLLADACEVSRTGLVLGYRSAGEQVRERLGRGNAAIAFMRLGNGADARAASELIGTEHRFVVGQLTDTVGTSYTDTWGDSYTSTVGTSDSVADSTSISESTGRSRGRGRSRQDRFAPFGDFTGSSSRDASHSVSESSSVSLTEGLSSGTSWGLSLSRALGENASLGRTAQRSREFLVEADELQRLPPSAVIVSYPGPAGRTVVLADANPAIGTLPSATTHGLDEERAEPATRRRRGRVGPAAARAVAGAGAGAESGDGDRLPNLGPPAQRLDWRRPA